jgi:hypothetical protein
MPTTAIPIRQMIPGTIIPMPQKVSKTGAACRLIELEGLARDVVRDLDCSGFSDAADILDLILVTYMDRLYDALNRH